MAAPPEARGDNLQLFKNSIKEETLTIDHLKDFAQEVSRQNEVKENKMKIFIMGEISILFNRFNNNAEIMKIEKKGKIFFQPLSETLYCIWKDYAKKLNNKMLERKLSEYKAYIKDISLNLKESSPFDEDLEALDAIADEKLGLFNGAYGRYRIAKIFRTNGKVDGIITMASMYENTDIILGIIREKYQNELNKPVLSLAYDGSSYSNNEDLIDNFIFYL